jgi:hypothetical protein
MTHRHFIAFARFLRAHPNLFRPLHVSLLADFLLTQNPRFNPKKFLSYVHSKEQSDYPRH